MTEQKRIFPLGEVNIRTGRLGEVRFDQSLLHILGIQPGDFVEFTISQDGVITITREKKAISSPRVAGITPTNVTQSP